MKTVINGKTLDTDRAILIVHVNDNDDPVHYPEGGPFSYSVGLYYRPRSHDFFFAGEGGLCTMFRGKKRLFVVPRHVADSFARRHHADPEKIKRYFPE